MVLGGEPPGRVGRRRNPLDERGTRKGAPPSRPDTDGTTAHPALHGPGAILIGPPSPRPCSPCSSAERRASSPRSHRAPASQQLRPFRRLLARRRPEGRRFAVGRVARYRLRERAQRFDRRPFERHRWGSQRRVRRRIPRCRRVAQWCRAQRCDLRWWLSWCGRIRAFTGCFSGRPGRASGAFVEHLEPQRCTAARRGSRTGREAGLEGRAR